MTVRLAQSIGNKKILDLTKKVKIYNNPKNLLSFSLGAGETTLLNLANAYGIFVNGGKMIEPSLIDLVQDRDGKTIYRKKSYICSKCNEISINNEDYPRIVNTEDRVLSEATSYQTVSILEGVIDRGTGKRMRNLKIPLAGKTGTTQSFRDAWFIGFTPDLVIGVYFGFDNPKTLGKFETGAKAAMPIFQEIIKNLPKKNTSSFFKIPTTINLSFIDIKKGLSSKNQNKKGAGETFRVTTLPLGDKNIDLNEKLSSIY